MSDAPCPIAALVMEEYDKLSKSDRDKIKYSINSIGASSASSYRKYAMASYGHDHPQAQGEFCWPLKT